MAITMRGINGDVIFIVINFKILNMHHIFITPHKYFEES